MVPFSTAKSKTQRRIKRLLTEINVISRFKRILDYKWSRGIPEV